MTKRSRTRSRRSRRRSRRPEGSRWRRIAWRLVASLAALYLAINLLAVTALATFRWIDPPTSALRVQRRIEAIFDGRSYHPVRIRVPLDQISPHLQHAVIAAEDGRFFDHGGIDWQELDKLVKSGEVRRGASTITQQLVKNLFFGTRARWLGKGFELTLAPAADAVLSKQRILELYLNLVEWDDGVYGAAAASKRYYGLPPSALDRDRAARLAACLPAPRTRRPERMDNYSAIILQRMAGRGW